MILDSLLYIGFKSWQVSLIAFSAEYPAFKLNPKFFFFFVRHFFQPLFHVKSPGREKDDSGQK